MRCKTCDYPLWSLTARQCPECGEPFLPSDFDFVPSSVQFRCPHCQLAYYGTSRRGHLVPDEFECRGCNRRVRLDETVVQPAPGYTEGQTRPHRLPWLDRHRGAWFRCLWDTTWRSMTRPGSLMRGLPEGSGSLHAWWYMLLINVFVLLAVMLPLTIVMMAFALSIQGMPSPAVVFATSGLSFGIIAVATLVVTFLFVLVWGPTTHALICVGGGKPLGGMKRTFEALCYSSGAYASSIIPCLGWNFGWIWWIVSAVLMVKEGQRVSGGRATIAVLAWPVLTTLIVFSAYTAWIAYSLTQMQAAVVTQTTLPMGDLRFMLDAVRDHAAEHGGEGPGHALEMLAERRVPAYAFAGNMTTTMLTDVPVGDVTLADVGDDEASEEAICTEIDRQPADVVAHRVGDFVFTYHGIEVADADPALWLVLLVDERRTDPIVIGTVGGSTFIVSQFELSDGLESQNRLRAREDLPPLPDPRTLRYRAPAILSDTADE